MTGKAAYESSPADTIRRMVEVGELPAGRTCAVSGKPTDDVLEFEVLVPRSFRNDGDRAQRALDFWLKGSIIGYFVKSIRPPKIDETDAVRVRAPMHVSAIQHVKVRRMSQRRLKKLLCTVPVFAELLQDNPLAQVSVA
jgi:hypothetical protein